MGSHELDPLDDLDRAQTGPVQVRIERRRYGKLVTVVYGLGASTDLAVLARELKQRLATGGSVKGGEIELQGDHTLRLPTVLADLGLMAK